MQPARTTPSINGRSRAHLIDVPPPRPLAAFHQAPIAPHRSIHFPKRQRQPQTDTRHHHPPITHLNTDHRHAPTAMTTPPSSLALKIEFGGGLELLFGGQRTHRITLPALVPADNATPSPSSPSHTQSGAQVGLGLTANATDAREGTAEKAADVEYLIHWMRDCMLTERPELFMEGATV
jgi:ubiquitin related modifier 1